MIWYDDMIYKINKVTNLSKTLLQLYCIKCNYQSAEIDITKRTIYGKHFYKIHKNRLKIDCLSNYSLKNIKVTNFQVLKVMIC